MDKKKQIEEMARIIGQAIDHNSFLGDDRMEEIDMKGIAEELLEKYQPKIPEGAVVIDKNENPCLSCPVPKSEREIADCSTICGAIQLGIDWKNQCRVLVRDYNRLENDYQQLRKETAEKFAEMVKKNSSYCYATHNGVKVGDTTYTISEKKIDEICKEISEGSNDSIKE